MKFFSKKKTPPPAQSLTIGGIDVQLFDLAGEIIWKEKKDFYPTYLYGGDTLTITIHLKAVNKKS